MPAYSGAIAALYRHGEYSPEGQRAIARLIKGGRRALEAFLAARKDPPPSELSGRDLHEALILVLGQFAREIPDQVLDRFEAGEIDEFELYWALGMGRGRRSIDVLIDGLKSKQRFCRWAAAEALIQRRSRKALPALIASLKDRSPDVKFAVVSAMRRWRELRRSSALPALRKIVASQLTRQHHPGLHRYAAEMIQRIEGDGAKRSPVAARPGSR
jgi:hypothetical protein